MARYKKADNPFKYINYKGTECVEFETIGKNKHKVIVDRNIWDEYLKEFSWTAIKSKSRVSVKTSINKQSKALWRVIIEHTYSELDYWGSTIDHINNNPLDNTLDNLRIFNTAILNTTNISSKYSENDMQYIYLQAGGYKVHYNISGETYYKHFRFSDYESKNATLDAAKAYVNEEVIPHRNHKLKEMIKKTRDIEFERGLKNKLIAEEHDEIIEILKKYKINFE